MKMSQSIRTIEEFFQQTFGRVDIHSIFFALLDCVNYLLQALKRMNAQFNPLIKSVQEPPTIILQENGGEACCRPTDIFVITGFIILTAVVVRYIWSGRRSNNNKSEDSQATKEVVFRKEDYSKFKELYKILQTLKHYFTVFPEKEIMSPFTKNSAKGRKKRMISKSIFSDVSKHPSTNSGNEDKYAKVKENLKKALSILEEQIETKQIDGPETKCREFVESWSHEGEISEALRFFRIHENNYPIITSAETSHRGEDPLLKFPNSNPPLSIFEKEMKGKSIMSDVVDESKPVEHCRVCCSKTDQTLLPLHQEIDYKPVVTNSLAEYRGANTCMNCLKVIEAQNSLRLKLMDLESSSLQKKLPCDCATLEVSSKRGTEGKGVLNVSDNRNTVNIEILFNRNVQLK